MVKHGGWPPIGCPLLPTGKASASSEAFAVSGRGFPIKRLRTGHSDTIRPRPRCLPPLFPLSIVGGTLAMLQVVNADHCANRLLAALKLEDFACLEPHLELV